ncbi:MAG TPA: DUF2784 domain-containing protein [Povalibacter sp.]|uniref:DUF2784 domain-containing protein n=2 Tax=Povalibacter sp. TaxID=1962978 RepID=UPI002C302993|nr:DUF2784 domain-containing protein [Povalibacter sp.]HMN45307.1 DUF2784 domain-containing protein [Povalibacter sp.]
MRCSIRVAYHRRMLVRVLADAVLVIHLAFVIFVVAGGFLALRFPRVAWLHVPAALWGAWIEFSGRICPLTPLENSLRRRGGEAGYGGGFIDHYIMALLYPEGLTREVQFVIGGGVLLVNVIAYTLLVRRLQRRRASTVASHDDSG